MKPGAVQTDLLEAAVAALPADKLAAVRQAALAQFTASGLPTTRHEDWKYTNLSPVAELSNAWLSDTSATSQPAEFDTGVTSQIDAHWLVIENGIVDAESFADLEALRDSGLAISRLAEGADESAIATDDPLSAFNAALLQDGLRLKLAAGRVLDKPIGLLTIDDGSVAVTQSRILIDVEENARLQWVEVALSGGGERQFANTVTQATLSSGAVLDVVRIQGRQQSHFNVNRFTARLSRDARLNYNNFEFGGGLARNDIIGDILEPGAEVNLHGLYLASGQQHIDNHTRVDHRVGPAKSTEEYRGILNGRSRCVFNGKAVVHKGADGTDADQANHNLLLSDKAEIDTKPELEIYADDVKCSHGATVGQLDKNALFYLRSRGLGRDQATQVLTRAFASAILGKLAIDECADYLAALLDRKLDALIDDK
ncbi:MAG: Fe-S cluster assembly protein SufD [Woeseiaceae bacterium]|nr:Fe-S cluster assembly protein SufD [Woeseiaceae bacterium]